MHVKTQQQFASFHSTLRPLGMLDLPWDGPSSTPKHHNGRVTLGAKRLVLGS